MRRALAVVGLVLAVGGFIMMPLSILFNINFIIPIGMIIAAFLILLKVKGMPSELDDGNSVNNNEQDKDGQNDGQ